MPFYSGDRYLEQHEVRFPYLSCAGTAEGVASKLRPTLLHPLRLLAHTDLEFVGPISLNEVVATVQRQQPRVIQVRTGPAWHMQCSSETVASLYCGDESLLKCERRFQP